MEKNYFLIYLRKPRNSSIKIENRVSRISHTYATRCFEANVAPKIVQEQLGHASLKITMDLYTHVTETKRLEELEKFSVLTEMTFEAADEVAEYRFKKRQKVRAII